jgi:heme-degrading monooxygenase HmoA
VILEHAVLPVTSGREEEFETAMTAALPLIESAPDCFGAEVRRQHENGSIYLLLIRWGSVETHMAFRESDLFQQWRALTHIFYSEPPTVVHYHEPLPR